MRFADFHVGQVLEAGPYALTEAAILDFARAWDPQWFHTDPVAARQSRFGGLIASGWQTCGIAMRLAADHFLAGSESFASPGLDQVRWPHPVRPGDRLRLRCEVTEARRSSKGDVGVLRWRWQLFNQDGTQVLEIAATSLFDLAAQKPV